MKVIQTLDGMRDETARWHAQGYSVGFVPTMGALHVGHLSLSRRARRENDVVVVSIFVNPLQFGPKEDFKKYPRTLRHDLDLLKKEGVNAVFIPKATAMYGTASPVTIRVPSLSGVLEGKIRPGHFEGVATVVSKLFNLVQPTRAYFGLKDYQQVRVIESMVQELNMPLKIVRCPTVRESDGLACSSRNRYLSPREREEAVKTYQALYLARELVTERLVKTPKRLIKRLQQIFARIPKCRVDYLVLADPWTLAPMTSIRRPAVMLAAVRFGKTRLIDNMLIP